MVTDPIHENATGSYLSGTIFRVMLNPENGRRERHRMEKRIAFPGSYYDTIRFEKWLDRRAAEGLRFKRFQNQGKIPVFQMMDPLQIRYYVEPDFGQYKSEEREKAYTDLGWTFVEELRGTCLVYESEDLFASKPKNRFEERDWARKWRKLILGQIGLLFLEILSIYILLKPFVNLTDYYGTKEPAVISLFLITCLLILQNLWPLGANIYDIWAWNRCMRMGEETDEWKGIVILRWGEVILFWVLVALFLPLICLTTYITI